MSYYSPLDKMDIHGLNQFFTSLDHESRSDREQYFRERFPSYPHIGRRWDPSQERIRCSLRQIIKREFANFSFDPLLSYILTSKKYLAQSSDKYPLGYKYKNRPIKMCSHRDRILYGAWSYELSRLHKSWLIDNQLLSSVSAYVPETGESNIEAAARAFAWISHQKKWTVRCMDVTGFFDELAHQNLKEALVALLRIKKLSVIDYRLFRAVTKYSYFSAKALSKAKKIVPFETKNGYTILDRNRFNWKSLVDRNILTSNKSEKGVPQGLPCSGALANIYMMKFDLEMRTEVQIRGGIYMRYADDLFLGAPSDEIADELEDIATTLLKKHGLNANPDKTEPFSSCDEKNSSVSYLGLVYHQGSISIRPESIIRFKRRTRGYIASYVKKCIKREHRNPSRSKIHAKYGHQSQRSFLGYLRRVQNYFDRCQSPDFDTSLLRKPVVDFEKQIDRWFDESVRRENKRLNSRAAGNIKKSITM